MAKIKARFVWNADVSLRLRNLALGVTYDEERKGGRTVRLFKPQEWLDSDGNIIWDTGKRLRGWLIQQSKTIRPSLSDALRYGLKCDTLPKYGKVPIAKIEDVTTNPDFPEKDKTDYYIGEELEGAGLGYPFKETFTVSDRSGRRSIFTFHYLIEKPIEVKAKIYSFARNFMPESAKSMLNDLGMIMGLGDKYSQGFGCFELLDFKHEIKELNI